VISSPRVGACITVTLGNRRHRTFKSPSYLTSSAQVLEVVLARLLIFSGETPVAKIQSPRKLCNVSAGCGRSIREPVGPVFAN